MAQAAASLSFITPNKLQVVGPEPWGGEGEEAAEPGALPGNSTPIGIMRYLPTARCLGLPSSPHSTPEPQAGPQGCQLLVLVSIATPHLPFWFLMTYWHVW